MKTFRYLFFVLFVPICGQSQAQVFQNPDSSVVILEVSAQPVKGMPSFYKWMGKNLKFPKTARKARVTGTVYVEFVVRPDGAIDSVRCIKGIGYGCDEEAVRVIKLAPKWIPGESKGVKAWQRFTIPVIFKAR